MAEEKNKNCLMCGEEMLKTVQVCPVCGADCSDARYKERKQWIKKQFNMWTGVHKEFEKIIRSNLGDAKGYEHTKMMYLDATSHIARDEINEMLANGAIDYRVDIGDMFIKSYFTIKNSEGKKVKKLALAISSYHQKKLIFLGFE